MEQSLRHVVKLARIDLTPEEEARMAPQMAEILKYVDQLKELNVDGVEPTAHAVPLTNVMREDVVGESLSRGDALRNAPQQAGGLFVVPKIVE
ncbi:MAG: Asp-tRNA(Asn)/Glu-tRNA(Gln) amidotransferase GatCAB subunit C [Verrucomicrobiales bacterium]|nr:Asp-tRNA(Asn)/Glu-tRNA(Gln) amidotransferase GatCAB subunit C [Verrucomicrobiales bacterium]|tara:strand:+ start:31663 stop:31941 length:279 start_codon:yes stop_codon:yes gene_type:complete